MEDPRAVPATRKVRQGGLTAKVTRRTLAPMSDGFPQAPSQEEWDALSAKERARVVASLPGEVTDAEMSPPEGDRHFQAKVGALEALRDHFAHQRRRPVYVA